MNDDERKICARVKLVREHFKWPQPAFASEMGITVNVLASIEYGRTPLRYSVANSICGRFNVNQRWLAEGRKPKWFAVAINPEAELNLPPHALFSEAYKMLKEEIAFKIKVTAKLQNCREADIDATMAITQMAGENTSIEVATLRIQAFQLIRRIAPKLPPHLYLSYFRALHEATERFEKEHNAAIEDHLKLKKNGA